MSNEIRLLNENDKRGFDDLDWIDEFYNFLQGKVPESITLVRGHKPKLTARQAETIVWYLQEHFPIIPSNYEVCDTCGSIYNSHSQGHYSELTGKCYCNEGCEPRGLYQKELLAEKKADRPFQIWLKKVKKEQNNYPAFKGKEINESYLRNLFSKNRTPIDALNDLITLT